MMTPTAVPCDQVTAVPHIFFLALSVRAVHAQIPPLHISIIIVSIQVITIFSFGESGF
jgi:hypothetical protein